MPTEHFVVAADRLTDDNEIGRALIHGALRATVEYDGKQIALTFKCRVPGSTRTVPYADADVIYIDQPRSWDKVAILNPPHSSRNPGTLFVHPRADATRVWAAKTLLRIAMGLEAITYGDGRDARGRYERWMTLGDGRIRIVLSAECMRCGDALDRTESIQCGFGPTCAAIVGVPHAYTGAHQVKTSSEKAGAEIARLIAAGKHDEAMRLARELAPPTTAPSPSPAPSGAGAVVVDRAPAVKSPPEPTASLAPAVDEVIKAPVMQPCVICGMRTYEPEGMFHRGRECVEPYETATVAWAAGADWDQLK